MQTNYQFKSTTSNSNNNNNNNNNNSIRSLLCATIALSSLSLDLRNRQLTSLTDEFALLKRLEYLYLENNKITKLQREIVREWRCLRWLDLRNNLLVELPDTIEHIRNLRTLLLSGNRLKSLPVQLGCLSKLTGLNLTGNPITDPPREIIYQGTRAILVYLQKKMPYQSNEFTIQNQLNQFTNYNNTFSPEYANNNQPLFLDFAPELTFKKATFFHTNNPNYYYYNYPSIKSQKRFPSPANFPVPAKLNLTKKRKNSKLISKQPQAILTEENHQQIYEAQINEINQKYFLKPKPLKRKPPLRPLDNISNARLILHEMENVRHSLDPSPLPQEGKLTKERTIGNLSKERILGIYPNLSKDARQVTGNEGVSYRLAPFSNSGLNIL